MCGFVASVGCGEEGEARQIALGRLLHRGPDAQGEWQGEEVWLGHRRLTIVDLSADGNQPLLNEDNTLVLVCNGEIYNAPALRLELQHLGHVFRSKSDNEVILHAFEAWGEGCLARLQGMFAFALWHVREKALWLVRDPMGMKPLYYARHGAGLAAASEAAPLLALLPHLTQPDPLAMAYLLTLGYVPSPHAIWQGVSKLPAGHALWWQGGEIRLSCYWSPPRHVLHDKPISQEDWQTLFSQVLDDHLMADVPISLFLSAGLDSTSLAVGLAMKGLTLPTFTMDFANSPRNEAPAAQELAQSLGFPHHGVTLAPGQMDHFMKQAGLLDEPIGTSGPPLYLAICQEAARHGKVVLGGDGGDEAMGGYTWYRNLSPLPSRTGHRVRKTLASLISRPTLPLMRTLAARSFANTSLLHRHAWRIFPRFLPEEVTWLLSPLAITFDDEAMLSPMARHFDPRLPLPRALQRVDLLTYCSDYNNTKVDRSSMAHGLEVRLPFLDRRLVEYHLQCPWDEREEKLSKPVLRNFLAGRVKEDLLKRPKQGFSMRGDPPDWQGLITFIEQGVWVKENYWHAKWKNLLLPGVPYREGRIWTLAMLTHWGNYWLGKRHADIASASSP